METNAKVVQQQAAAPQMEGQGEGMSMLGPDGGSALQRQAAADDSPQVRQLRSMQEAANASPQVRQLRRQGEAMNAGTLQRKENKTGMPDQLKSGVESLSGLSMDDVKVHYNSDKPSQLNAHAYAQGADIHVAPGQEQHLPHEAWHVAQQKQGRVQATTQLKGVGVNDDSGLEREADVMGAKAMQMKSQEGPAVQRIAKSADGPAQLVKSEDERGKKQSRRHEAEETIAELGTNIKAGLRNHIYDASPIAGGDIDKDNPSGLHAYTNGALPSEDFEEVSSGKKTKVHTLKWKYDGGKEKESTMFPNWMPETHVNTLIAMKFPAVRNAPGDGTKIHQASTKEYIQRGLDIYSGLTKSGDTVYPTV